MTRKIHSDTCVLAVQTRVCSKLKIGVACTSSIASGGTLSALAAALKIMANVTGFFSTKYAVLKSFAHLYGQMRAALNYPIASELDKILSTYSLFCHSAKQLMNQRVLDAAHYLCRRGQCDARAVAARRTDTHTARQRDIWTPSDTIPSPLAKRRRR